MGLTILSANDVASASELAVGLTAAAPKEQFIAASLRRAASLMCPTTPTDLIRSVARVLKPISREDDDLEARVSETLDALVGAGDLVEAVETTEGIRRRLIYLGHPRYVRRRTGDVVLLGVRPDARPIVGDELAPRVEQVGYLRRVPAAPDLYGLLSDYGIQEIKASRWIRAPEIGTTGEFLHVYEGELAVQPPSGEIPDLRVLDPDTPVTYYTGRWRAVNPKDSARFVARRSQGYGADLWCYVEVQNGEPIRMIDLPILGTDRGCDEAWRLQAAIDARRGHPQQISVSETGVGTTRLGLQAPPPRWLQRRWDLLGRPVRTKGALFAYDLAAHDLPEELSFAVDHLWLERTTSKDST